MSHTARVGPYEVVPFRAERNATLDTLRWAKKRHHVPILVEVDVTAAREAIRSHRKESGKALSFTAWVVGCVARAAAEHPRVHSLRRGRRKLVLFHDVDVAVLVERTISDGSRDETIPMPVVIRRADQKNPLGIHEEIRGAQEAVTATGAASIDASGLLRLQSVFFRLPAWLRDALYWRWLLRSPARMKKTMGTVVVTAAGMTTPGLISWGIPLALHPLAIAVGGIAERWVGPKRTEMLALTVVFDHAVTDGAPVGRFIHSLHQLLSKADGLT